MPGLSDLPGAQELTHRRLALILVIALVGAACAPQERTTDPDAPVTTPTSVPQVVGEEPPCVRLGYPCEWTEEALDRTRSVSEEMQTLVDSHPDRRAGLGVARARLEDRDDVVEVLVDPDGSGLLFRLENAGLGHVVGVPAESEGPWEPLDPDILRELFHPEPVLENRNDPELLPVNYRPAGGPLEEPREVLLVHPFHTYHQNCEISADSCHRWSQGTESMLIKDNFDHSEHPFNVRIFAPAGGGLDHANLVAALAGSDLIHITGATDRFCDERCVVGLPWVRATKRDRDIFSSLFPEGVPTHYIISDDDYWILDLAFFLGFPLSPDTIMVINTNWAGVEGDSAPDRPVALRWVILDPNTQGLVGVLFWSLMVKHGLTVGYAASNIASRIAGTDGVESYFLINTLLPDGRRESEATRRARDTVSLHSSPTLDNRIGSGHRIIAAGTPGDGNNDYFAAGTWVLVEAARTGWINPENTATIVQLLIDDRPLPPINLAEKGELHQDLGRWAHWKLDLAGVDLGFDLQPADTDPFNPRPHTIEVRVYHDATRYTAHRVDPVYFALNECSFEAQVNELMIKAQTTGYTNLPADFLIHGVADAILNESGELTGLSFDGPQSGPSLSMHVSLVRAVPAFGGMTTELTSLPIGTTGDFYAVGGGSVWNITGNILEGMSRDLISEFTGPFWVTERDFGPLELAITEFTPTVVKGVVAGQVLDIEDESLLDIRVEFTAQTKIGFTEISSCESHIFGRFDG